MFER
jgi:hypothetical protein